MLISEPPGYAARFAELAADFSAVDLPDSIRQAVIRLFVEGLAAMLAGSDRPEMERLRSATLPLTSAREATVLARGFAQADRSVAAFLNATAGTTSDADDRYPWSATQAALMCIPAALGEAEVQGASGADLAAAIVVGIEAADRAARATTFTRPVEQASLWSALASAVAVAKLRGDSASRIACATSIGAALTLNTARTSCLANGAGAHAGFLAIDLIDAGFTALGDALEVVLGNIAGDAFDGTLFDAHPGAALVVARYHDPLGTIEADRTFRRVATPMLGECATDELLDLAHGLFGMPDVTAFVRRVASLAALRATPPHARSTPIAQRAGSEHYLDELCDFLARVRCADIPADVRHCARRVLLDDIGAIIRGSAEAEIHALARIGGDRLEPPHGATLFGGSPAHADMLQAALVNGTAACFVEADGGHWFAPAHGGIYVIPAALAWGEHADVSGEDFLAALVAGYEAAARLAAATTLARPFHPHGLWSVFGSAVAVTKLMGGDASALRRAILVAACLTTATSYRHAFDGASVRNAYNGRSNAAGIVAALAARAGIAGLPEDLEGFLGHAIGAAFHPERVTADLGRTFEITRHYHKVHATDGTMHPGLDAMLVLRQRHPLEPERIDGIEVATFRQATWRSNPSPTTLLAAKYSYSWALATAAVRGAVGVDDFGRDALQDPRIARLARRVTLVADGAMSEAFPRDRHARVTVTLVDGSRHEHFVANPRGGFHDPLTDEALAAKFVELTHDCLADPARVIQAIGACDTQASVRDFVRELRQQVRTAC